MDRGTGRGAGTRIRGAGRGAGTRMAATLALLGVAASLLGGCEKAEPAAEEAAGSSASRPLEPWRGGDRAGCTDLDLPEAVADLRCGSIEVPFEREDPSLGSFELAYGVLPRRERSEPSAGAIFITEGGPGYAGVRYARTYREMLGPLLDDHDLVLVDTRGTGDSATIDCPALQHGRGDRRRALADCADELGERASSYRTSAAADDLESLRSALGLGRISVVGGSYGTYLAQSYAFRHPDSLKALVIDSAYPLFGETAWYPSLLPTGLRALELSCRRSAGCSGDPVARFGRAARLMRARDGTATPLLDALINSAFGPPASYLQLDSAIGDYLRGDRERLERKVAPGDGDFGDPRIYSYGMELAFSCNDYPTRWSKRSSPRQRERELEDAIAAHPRRRTAPFTPQEVADSELYGYGDCIVWPQPTELYEPPARSSDPAPSVPTLVIAGELDDITTPVEADMAAATFEDARRITIRNAGHVPSQYPSRYKAHEAVRRFLEKHG